MSVDLTGSTALKRNYPQAWPGLLGCFFSFSTRRLQASWYSSVDRIAKIFKKPPRDISCREKDPMWQWVSQIEDPDSPDFKSLNLAPMVWKTLGDEVIFVKPITNAGELVLLVDAVRNFFERHEDVLSVIDLDGEFGLKIKGTIWLANAAPLRLRSKDRETIRFGYHLHADRLDGRNLVVPRALEKMFTRQRAARSLSAMEFLGPEMDEGFRVSGYSEVGYIPISLSLTRLFLDLQKYLNSDYKSNLSFERGVALKGIFSSGKNYPKILLNTKSEERDHSLADDLPSQELEETLARKSVIENFVYLQRYLDEEFPIDENEMPRPAIFRNGVEKFTCM